MRWRTNDVPSTTTSRYIATTPNATGTVFHADPPGTKSSFQPKWT